ncbi:MAG: ABC transporter permease [Chitinophagaceae bacterium]|nr:ABC transporter permease [Chitinophagaceae bacterium]
MVKTYFKTAFRNLVRNRKHAILNILGLGVALAACIIVFLVIQFEYSHNKHLKGYNNLYQVVTRSMDADGEHFTPGMPFPTTKFLRQDYPQYQFAQLMQDYGVQITVKGADGSSSNTNKKFWEEKGIFYGEPELMQLFEIKFLSGDANVLKDVNSVVLCKSMAEKYYGNWKEAIGKRIVNDNADFDLQVAGVFEDMPDNSDFPFKMVSSYAGFVAHNGNGWPLEDWGSNTSNHQVYVSLPNGTNTAALDQQLGMFEKKYNTENKDSKRSHFLHPLKDIHFDERFSTNGDHVTSKASLYTLAFIGMLIILMACINFVNLSTALAVTRSKEVGIRKVMGSSKNQLTMQVLIETAAVVLVAAIIAIILVQLALPHVKNIMVVQSKLSLFNAGSLLFIFVIIAVTILLSGVYPAFIMGRFKPVEAIKNKITTSKVGSVSLRRVLVVLQFAFSQIFIIATIIAITQMNFIKSADLGFNKESVLLLTMNSDSVTGSRHEAFKDALMSRSDVKHVCFGFDAPSSDNSWQSNFAFDKMEDREFSVQLKMGDDNYVKTYGLQLIAGKFYGAGDTAREYVVNETLLKKVGVTNPQEAIGKMFRLGGGRPMPVVGVVKDFKQQSMRDAVQPIVMLPKKNITRQPV